MQSSGSWNGYGYNVPQRYRDEAGTPWAIPGQQRDGSASYQNAGNAIYIAGSWTGTYSTGTQDINITGNIFKHISTGLQIAGGGTSPTDPPAALRIAFTNNLLADLNRDLYQGLFSPGFGSGPFSNAPMSGDLTICNNTVGLTRGNGPAWWTFGGDTQTSVLGEGLNLCNNVSLVSLGFLGCFLFDIWRPESQLI